MEDFHEGFTRFWETLTGVFVDERSKIIRLSSFVILSMGIIWAGLNYFQAKKIANLDEDYSSYSEIASQSKANNETMEKLVDIAQTVGTMRRGGVAIAETISGTGKMPFNIAGYNELGLEDLNSTANFKYKPGHTISGDAVETIDVPEPPKEGEPPELVIKALMLAGRNRYAVINYASKAGHVVRQGQELPGGGGRIVRITKDGLTVRFNGKEINYTVQ